MLESLKETEKNVNECWKRKEYVEDNESEGSNNKKKADERCEPNGGSP